MHNRGSFYTASLSVTRTASCIGVTKITPSNKVSYLIAPVTRRKCSFLFWLGGSYEKRLLMCRRRTGENAAASGFSFHLYGNLGLHPTGEASLTATKLYRFKLLWQGMEPVGYGKEGRRDGGWERGWWRGSYDWRCSTVKKGLLSEWAKHSILRW